MSEGPVKFIELVYEFDCDSPLHEIIDVCASVRKVGGVVDAELCKAIAVPGAEAPIRGYKLIVGLENKTGIGAVQGYLGQYRDEVTNLKIGLYIGSCQKLD